MSKTGKSNRADISRRSLLKYSVAGFLAGAAAPLLPLLPAVAAQGQTGAAPATVYFTGDISSAGIARVFEGVKNAIAGKVAFKLHVGDPGNKNFIAPDLVKDLCLATRGTLCDSNVFYGGPRAETASHRATARDHGFTFAPYDVLDADGDVELPVNGGRHMQRAVMGKNIMNYDSIIIFSHFKGHQMAGYGGAIKNIAMGIASKRGKGIIHGGANWNLDDAETRKFLERLVEFGKGMEDARKGRVVYINVLNKLSTRCDCSPTAPPPVMPDIGVVAATDIVAVEKASLDLVLKHAGAEGNELTRHIAAKQGAWAIAYAEKIGMGSSRYNLVTV